MASELGSLGLGSGVLTKTLWEQLKTAEENARIKPYETKIEKNSTKQKALTELTTKLSTFQSAVSSLGDATAFTKRKVTPSVTGDSAAATLTASNGVAVQNLSLKVDKIAQQDVYQSKGLTGKTDNILKSGQSAASFMIMQNGKEYTINVDANTTYEGLVEKINSATNGNVVAKIVSTGEAGTPYRLTLSSKESGTDNAIGFFAGKKESGVLTENADSATILSNLGWSLKKTDIDEADLTKGYTFSGGIKASNVTDLNDQLGQEVKFTLFSGTEKFEISANATETYQDLINRVEQITNNKIKMNASGATNKTFNFVAGSNASSSAKITIFDGISQNGKYSSDATTSSFLKDLKFDISTNYTLDDSNGDFHIKKAQNAEFTLDGVKMYRSKNNITDIGSGLTLNLLKAGEINFDVKQDVEGISTTMEEVVEKYNELATYLKEVTDYNIDSKTGGDLNGVSEVSNISSTIIQKLFAYKSVVGTEVDKDGNSRPANVLLSLTDYGLSINSDTGLLSFKKEDFDEKLNKDVDAAEKFFADTTGFEELNVVGKAINFKNDIDFTGQEFKIVFNDKTYDLSKNSDGTVFKLESTLTQNQGETTEEFEARKAQDRVQKFINHINSLNIEDLKVSYQEMNITENGQQVKAYALKFQSDNGSAFDLSGDKLFLENFGLTAQKITPEIKTGTGIFGELKTTLRGYTRNTTSDTTKGSLVLYADSLKKENERLTESKKNDQTKIDEQYEALWNKWAEYESIISKIKQQGNQIAQMINASQSSSNS